MHRIVWSTAAVLAVGLTAGPLPADTVELSRGVQLEGQITREVESGPLPHVVVQLDDELKVAVPRSRVRKIIRDSELVGYAKAAGAAADDAERHYLLAIECKKQGLDDHRTYHLERAIELDPNHSKARAALGFVRSGNSWVLFSEQQKRRGMISVGGRWTVPEAYAREKGQEDADEAAKRWVKEFARQRTTYLKGDKRAADALAALQAISDPLAAQAFAKALEDSRENGGPDSQALRRMYVKKLGSFKTGRAVEALVKTGYEEPDDNIRDLALEQLQSYGGSSAVATYLPLLTNDAHKPIQVKRALRALNYFPDPEMWRVYVDALITTHKTKIPKGAGMQTGFNNRGGGGLTTGGKDEIRIDHVQNPAALQLLKQIAPGVDFRFDKNAWRNHFAQQLMRTTADSRRDP